MRQKRARTGLNFVQTRRHQGDQRIPETARCQPETKRCTKQHKTADGARRQGAEYGRQGATKGVTDQKWLYARALARDFRDAIADGLCVFCEAIIAGRSRSRRERRVP